MSEATGQFDINEKQQNKWLRHSKLRPPPIAGCCHLANLTALQALPVYCERFVAMAATVSSIAAN